MTEETKRKTYTPERAAKISATHKLRGIKPNPLFSVATQFKKGMKMPQWMIEKRTDSVLGSKHLSHTKGSNHKNWCGGQARFKCADCKKVLASRYAERCMECKAGFCKGKNCPSWKGGKPKCPDCHKVISYTAKKCNKCAAPKGEKSPHWIQDRTKIVERHKEALSKPRYTEWRNNVFKRDLWRCKIADKNCKGQTESHHILPWRDYPELRYEVNNGITLCHAHHPRKRAEEKRLSPYFMELVSVLKN